MKINIQLRNIRLVWPNLIDLMDEGGNYVGSNWKSIYES